MKDKNLKDQIAKLSARAESLQKYSLPAFVVFVVLLYGFLMFRINTLSNASPSTTVIDDQVKGAHVPHIDQAIVSQLQSLQDNSVSVKSLFTEARANPFQE
jgi:hypothetical protein